MFTNNKGYFYQDFPGQNQKLGGIGKIYFGGSEGDFQEMGSDLPELQGKPMKLLFKRDILFVLKYQLQRKQWFPKRITNSSHKGICFSHGNSMQGAQS